MSQLERLVIQGIRSFPPSGVNVTGSDTPIEFGTPITLITGDNGAGKTTVIESIYYAATGETPQGTSGQQFVHDFTMKDTKSTKQVDAMVELQFKSAINNKSCQLKRCATSSLSKKNQSGKQYKSTETSITINDQTTTPNMEIIQNNLGASKPLLKYIVLCHQSDVNWPVTLDSTSLEKRFEEIFGSDEYIKMEEQVKASIKELKSKQEALEEKVRSATKDRENFINFDAQAKDLKEKIKDDKEELDECNQSLAEQEAALNQLRQTKKELDRLTSEAKFLKRTIESQQNELDRMNEPDTQLLNEDGLEHRKNDLETLKKYQQSNLETEQQDTNNLNDNQEALKKLIDEERNLNQEIADISNTLNQRETLEQNYKEQMTVFKEKYHTDNYRAKEREIQDSKDSNDSQYQDCTRTYQEESKDLQNQKKQIENNLQRETSTLDRLKAKREMLKKNEEEVKANPEEYQAVKDKYNKAEKEYQDFLISDDNPDKLQADMQRIQRRLEEMKNEQDSLQKESHKYEEERNNLNRINQLKVENTELEKKNQEILAIVQAKFPDINEFSIRADFTKHKTEANLQQTRALKQKTQKESDLKNQQHNLADKVSEKEHLEAENQQFISQFEGYCSIDQYPQALEKIKNQIETARDACSRLEETRQAFMTFIKKAQERHWCPLCERDFDDDSKYEEFVKEHLKKEIENIPTQIQEKKLEIESMQTLQTKLLSLQKYLTNIERNNKQIQKIESQIKVLQEDIEKKEAEVNSLQKSASDSQQYSSELMSIETSVNEFVYNREKMEKNQVQINTFSKTSFDKERIQEITDRLNTLSNEIPPLERENSALFDLIIESNRKMSTLKQRLQNIKNELTKLEDELNKKQKLENELKQVEQEMITQAQKTVGLETNKKNIEKQIEDLNKAYQENSEYLMKEKARIDKDYTEIKYLADQLDDMKKKLDSLDPSSAPSQIQDLKSRRDNIMQLINEKEHKIERIKKRKEENQKRKEDTEEKLKKCKNDIAFLEIYLKIQSSNTQLAELNASITELQSKGNYEEAQETYNFIDKHAAVLRNRITENEKNLNKIEPQLEKLKDAKLNYNKKLMESVANKTAISDLTVYHKAIHETLDEYHREKMEQINTLIREMWSEVYRYHDISGIKIDVSKTEGSKKGRSYVVKMQKGKAWMEMKTASAGQKAMASLIIRIALHRVFCSKCGFIALDEPTNALDENNIGAFASNLTSLVKHIQKKNNAPFQMIVITHNKEFVDSLLKDSSCTFHFKITREQDKSSEDGVYYSVARREKTESIE